MPCWWVSETGVLRLSMSKSVKLGLEARAVVLPARHLICGSERVGALCLISSLCFVCALLPDFNMPLRVYLRSPSEIACFLWAPDHQARALVCLAKTSQTAILAHITAVWSCAAMRRSISLLDSRFDLVFISLGWTFTFIYLAETFEPKQLQCKHKPERSRRDLNHPVTCTAPQPLGYPWTDFQSMSS